jgi:hypothetical protein
MVTVNVLLFAALLTTMTLLLLRFHLLQVLVEPIEALLPQIPVARRPVGHFLERRRLDAAGPPLGFPPARDQARALEHAQMLGYRGQAHVKGLGQFGNRAFAEGKSGENGAPRRVGERGECGAELVGHTLNQ